MNLSEEFEYEATQLDCLKDDKEDPKTDIEICSQDSPRSVDRESEMEEEDKDFITKDTFFCISDVTFHGILRAIKARVQTLGHLDDRNVPIHVALNEERTVFLSYVPIDDSFAIYQLGEHEPDPNPEECSKKRKCK